MNLIQTPSNSGEERKGQIMGLDDDQFYTLMGCAIATLIGFWLFFSMGLAAGASPMVRLGMSVSPLVLGFVWVYGFLRGKPPGYQTNVLYKLMFGKDFHIKMQSHTKSRHQLITAGCVRFERTKKAKQ
jgi:hypothetical protein